MENDEWKMSYGLVLFFKDHLGDRMLAGVGQGQVHRRCSGFFKQLLNRPVKDQIGRARVSRGNLYVLPANSTTPTSLKRFERSFFRGEARGIVLSGYGPPTIAVRALRSGEDTFSEARRAHEHFTNSLDFDNVYTDGNNHR
ncbi:MAG TPA: hypothetical protein VE135_03845 [Pyrinomonadaceae bacterium]|nr:hypothetical protein [Pyrinomonadaceae bacterium]